MSDKENHTPNRMPETCKESMEQEKTMERFSEGFTNIAKGYAQAKKSNPSEARTIAKRQLEELAQGCSAYKILPKGQTNSVQSKMEHDLHDALTLLTEGTDKAEIMRIIYTNTSYTGDDIGSLKENNASLLLFLPEEYRTEDGEINKETVKNSIESDRLREMEEFTNGTRAHLPYFDNNDFTNHSDIITKALSKPWALLDVYEMLRISARDGDGTVTKNPEFVATVNNILAREYPDFFGKAENTEWHAGKGYSFDKITALLDIIKYQPGERASFLKMMESAENGDSEAAVKLYETRFVGTPIEESIRAYFGDSKLLTVCLLQESQKTLDAFKETHGYQKGGVLDIIENNEESKKFAQASFMYIPTDHLNTFLSLLPRIESHCGCGNTEGLMKEIDKLDIDAIYKMRFFCGLADALDRAHSDSSDIAFYKRIEKHYEDNVDISKEQKTLSESEKSGRELHYSIISKAFPGLDEEKLRQKNAAFGNFLDSAVKDGKINITSADLVRQLSAIFTGTPEADRIMETIRKSRDGKEVFRLLADAFSEKKTHQEKCLHDAGVNTEKWKTFQKEKRKESVVILRKLKDPSVSLDEKIRILKELGLLDHTKIPDDPAEKQKFINGIIGQLSALEEVSQNVKTFTNEENLKDFATYWRTGDYETFNKKAQERREEAERREDLRQWAHNNIINTAQFVDFRSFGTDFAKMDTGRVITTMIDGSEVFIRKDSPDEVSLFSCGIPVRQIKVSDQKRINEHIGKAMDSVQFLKDHGLDALNVSIPNIVDIINNRPTKRVRTRIDLSDGLDTEEQYTLLDTIARLADMDTPGGAPATRLDILKNAFRALSQGEGIISCLRKAGYIKEGSNVVNIFAVKEGMEKIFP